MEALAHEHRRQLLLELRDDNPHGETPTESGEAVRAEDLAIEMNHRHLPKLDVLGFVEWDRVTGTVYRGPRFDELEPHLDVIADDESELPVDDQ